MCGERQQDAKHTNAEERIVLVCKLGQSRATANLHPEGKTVEFQLDIRAECNVSTQEDLLNTQLVHPTTTVLKENNGETVCPAGLYRACIPNGRTAETEVDFVIVQEAAMSLLGLEACQKPKLSKPALNYKKNIEVHDSQWVQNTKRR